MIWQLITVLLICVGWAVLRKALRFDDRYDNREPVQISPAIPLIGHVLGMIKDGSSYYAKISASCLEPIYCLPVPKGKIYIVKSPGLAKAVDRSSRTISFSPYVYEFAKRILQPTPEALIALKSNPDKDHGEEDLCTNILQAMHATMTPGEHLDAMMRAFIVSSANLLDNGGVWSSGSTTTSIGLFASVRRLVGRASTDALYGWQLNPFRDPKVEAGFWEVDNGFASLGLNFLQQVLSWRAYRGREQVFKGFQRYYAADWRSDASLLVRARYDINAKHISRKDIEHFDLSVLIGLLVNTVPATSWVLYYIYSSPEFLIALREKCETLKTAKVEADLSANQKLALDIAAVVKEFPLLTAIIQETLRVQSTNAAGRVVLKDTILDDTYLLKKDAFVLIPSAEIHNSAEAWGSNHDRFDAERFMKTGVGVKHIQSAFRAFGGGANLCPGRFLAINEIATVAILCVLRYDLSPASGSWNMPKRRPHISTSILTPVDDIYIEVIRRKDFESSAWDIHWN